MVNSKFRGTNAADSAPGVGDGPRGAPLPPVDSKPAGRKWVLWLVVVALVVLALAFLNKPTGDTAVNSGVPTDQTQPRTAPAGAEP